VTTVFNQVASLLLAQVQVQLAATTAGVAADARVCLVPGQLAWDNCECGLIAVELVGTGFSRGGQDSSVETEDGCNGLATATYRVTVLRCAPGVGAAGSAPTCAELDAAAKIFYDDVDALLRGVSIAMRDMYDTDIIKTYWFNGTSPTGPDGRCVGSTEEVTVGVTNTYGAC